MNSLEIVENVEIAFHDVDYALCISTINGDTLCVEIEQKRDASRWRGDFTSRYIEDLTTKTGNFKKFPVFVRMLISAVKQGSDSVFIDLLTYQDLEALKSRKQADDAAPPSSRPPPPPSTASKRYLILTYAGEFDRVHYPLPLVFEEHPDPSKLQKVIVGLRSELDELRARSLIPRSNQDTDISGGGAGGVGKGLNLAGRGGTGGGMTRAGGGMTRTGDSSDQDFRKLKDENRVLKVQIKELMERAGGGGGGEGDEALSRELRAVKKERDTWRMKFDQINAEMDRSLSLQRRELRKKAKELQEARDESALARDQAADLVIKVRRLQQSLDQARATAVTSSKDRTTSSRPSSVRPSSSTYYPPGGRPSSSSRSNRQAPSLAQGGQGYLNSRPNSAPTSRPSSVRSGTSGGGGGGGGGGLKRFDPTEWVNSTRQKRLSGGGLGGLGGGSSGRSSPYSDRGRSPASSRGNSRPSSADYTRPRSSSPYLSSGNTSYGVGAGVGGRGGAVGGASGGANRLSGRPPPLVPPYSSSSSPTGAAAAANRHHSQSQERETERVRDGGGGDYRQGTRPTYPYPSSSQPRPIYQPNHHQQQPRSSNINSASSSPRMTTGMTTGTTLGMTTLGMPLNQPLNQHQHQHKQQQQRAASAATAVGGGGGLRGGGAMGSERPWAVKASIDPTLVTLPSDGGRGGGNRELINQTPASERSSSPGRALQDVKAKLSAYVSTSVNHPSSAPPPPSSHTSLPLSEPSSTYEDTSSEIQDIDSRLQALQAFLRNAKAPVAASPATGSSNR